MKLTEQEQAAVSRGMIEGLLRALHAKACCRPSVWSWYSSCCAQAADMLRVAAYCRVSTSQEDQRNSLENQRRYFSEYISRQPDWELVEVMRTRVCPAPRRPACLSAHAGSGSRREN